MSGSLMSFLPQVRAEDMSATITEAAEFGSERPCELGRIGYRIGVRITSSSPSATRTGSGGEKLPWFLTWVGEKGQSPGRLPVGVEPSLTMLAALEAAPADALLTRRVSGAISEASS